MSTQGTKPPSEAGESDLKYNKQQNLSGVEESAMEAVNLKHDLELQRFLAESHLLDNLSGSTSGQINRHKSTDLRLQSLGAKSSLFTQINIPSSHRRGMLAKAKQRETRRQEDAKQNGIIISRDTKSKLAKRKRREKGVGDPSIGRFRGGTLHLSKKDIGHMRDGGSKGGSSQSTFQRRRR